MVEDNEDKLSDKREGGGERVPSFLSLFHFISFPAEKEKKKERVCERKKKKKKK